MNKKIWDLYAPVYERAMRSAAGYTGGYANGSAVLSKIWKCWNWQQARG